MEADRSGAGEEVDDNDNPAKGFVIALLLSVPIWALIGLVIYLIAR